MACFKTDPDEKRTERPGIGSEIEEMPGVSRLIPMKRELKVFVLDLECDGLARFQD